MAEGRIGKAEQERLVNKMIPKQFVGAPFSGLKEEMGLSARVAKARAQSLRRMLAAGCLTGEETVLPVLAAGRAVKALAASGRRTEQATMSLICPQELREDEIRSKMRAVATFPFAISHVELRRERLAQTIIQVTVTGEAAIRAEAPENMEGDTYHIILCGSAGEEGTLLLYERNREMIEKRYPAHFLREILNYTEGVVSVEAVETGWTCGAEYQLVCGDGGVFAGLWELGEQLRCGMVVSVPDIPIRQQTIEICELLDRNPYQLAAGNCVLMVTRTPEALLQGLWARGYEAEDIGTLQMTAARELHNGEEVRYIEPYRGEQ